MDDPAPLLASLVERYGQHAAPLAAHAARLRAAAIDPRSMLEHGAPPVLDDVLRRGGDARPWLLALADYCAALPVEPGDRWSALHFCVPGFLVAARGDLERFRRLGEHNLALMRALVEQGTDPGRTLQYGVPAVARAVGADDRAFVGALAWAARLAARGAEPGFLLQLVVPAWHEAGGGDTDRLLDLLARLEPELEAIHRAGMHTGWPLSVGLAALGRYGAALAEQLGPWLARIRELVRTMLRAGAKPYGTLEYGVPGICAPEVISPAQVTALLELAVGLADRGLEPVAVLAEGFSTTGVDTAIALELAARLAQLGVDPYFILTSTTPALLRWHASSARAAEPEELAELLDQVVTLAASLHRAGVDGRKTFADGLPALVRHCAEQPEIFAWGFGSALRLAAAGVSPGMMLAFGIPDALVRGENVAWLPSALPALVEPLLAIGVDPATTLSYGVPVLLEVADGDAALFARLGAELAELVVLLHQAGVDHRDVLFHDVRALAEVGEARDTRAAAFAELLARLQELLRGFTAAGVDPTATLQRGVPAAARAALARPWLLGEALTLAGRLGGAGVDPGPLLEHAVPAVARALGDERAGFVAWLELLAELYRPPPEAAAAWIPWLRYAVAAVLPLAGGDLALARQLLTAVQRELARLSDEEQRDGVASTLPELASLVAGDPPALVTLLGEVRAAVERLASGGASAYGFVTWGVAAAVELAAGRRDVGRAAIAALVELLQTPVARASGATLLRHGARPALSVAGGDPGAFGAALTSMAEALASFAAQGFPVDQSGEWVLPLAGHAAAGQRERLREALASLVRLLASEAVRPRAAEILAQLAALVPAVARWPALWWQVLRPALETHQQHVVPILRALGYIAGRHLAAESDLELLRVIVTQTGVRASDVLQSLIAEGLATGVIGDLTGERELVVQFLRELPFNSPTIYATYRRLQQDEQLSATERRARTQALRAELETLAAAIRAGELTREQERSELLGLVLYYVFPPAMSSSQQDYLRLYHAMPDRPGDTARLDPGPCQHRALQVRAGAWEVVPGAVLEREPWRLLLEVALAPPAAPREASALGWQLLGRWVEGRLARESVRRELFAALLARFRANGMDLPRAAELPAQLLAFREFLGDHLRDLVEEALLAARAEDEVRYLRLVRDRLAPRPTVGPGLVKAVWATLEQARTGRTTRAEATRRLAGQLAAFAVEPDSLLERLARAEGPEELRAWLAQLDAREVELEPGKEIGRLLADLAGGELRAMNGELFGRDGAPGKLRYAVSDGGGTLALRLEVSKRKAHAAVGLAEGVCVAVDTELWNNPDFLQVIIWDESGLCAGGMHLLVCSDGGERYLALPGINPSLRLLDQVEPGRLLDLLCAFAWDLARHWRLAGVWLPASPGIHSNRRAIHAEVERRRWPARSVSRQVFSFRPFAYSFAEVLEVPAPAGEDAQPSATRG